MPELARDREARIRADTGKGGQDMPEAERTRDAAVD